MSGPELICPQCRAPLPPFDVVREAGGCACACGTFLAMDGGILCALPDDRRRHYGKFLAEYKVIRHAEGRGSPDAAYYRALPFCDLSGRNAAQWKIRAATFRYFQSKLLPGNALDVLDLGAGNGWLSYRLGEMGHRPVAVDIFTDPLDGLAAAAQYCRCPLVQAEFDRLPFADAQFDLILYNSSLHYSTDYRRTLCEARRCLRPLGRIFVLDSPLYRAPEHGEMMRAERRSQFQQQYGFPSDGLDSLEYLHVAQLAELARDLRLVWHFHRPWYGWAWHLRPLRARLKGRRPPSRFYILEAVPA